MIYIFDTNAMSDMLNAYPSVVANVRERQQDHIFALCPPVDYEMQRGLLWKTASAKHQLYLHQIKPQFQWLPLIDADWWLAGQFWANGRSAGKQFSDVDLLIAALAHRLNAIIVTNDADFAALPVQRENWRVTSRSDNAQ
jgi:predicted nucleic acid-binding protein